MFFSHKDYITFLVGNLTMFKLCNNGIVRAKVSRAIFIIVSAYFLVYEAYFIVGEFL
jgi:hypothetical protein